MFAARDASDTYPSCASIDCNRYKILSRAGSSWRNGDLKAAISLAEAAVQAPCDVCSEPCDMYARLQLILLLTSIRRIPEARQLLSEVSAAPVAQHDPKLPAVITLVKAKVALSDGEFVEAAELAETGLRLSNGANLTSWTPLGNLVMATTALRRGELSTAIHYADLLKEDAVFSREVFSSSLSAWIIVQITEAEKGRERAATLARELLESESAIRSLLIAEPAAVTWLIRMMLCLGERELAYQGVQFSEELASRNPDVPSLGAAALHAAGLVERDVEKVQRAAETHTDPWARTAALEDVGVLLSESRDGSAKAAQSFDLAMRAYANMGSLRDSSRVRSRLRRLDASPTTQVRYWPRSRIPGLTDTEYAVAKLVSNGLTNGQAADQMYLSRHTVAFHLRKIFQKVGVRSRLELAVMWNELDDDFDATNGTGGSVPLRRRGVEQESPLVGDAHRARWENVALIQQPVPLSRKVH